MEEFAQCSPAYFGISESESGREDKITRHLRKIEWFKPDRPRTGPANLSCVEAVVVLRRPSPSRPVPKKSFMESLCALFRKVFRNNEVEDSLLDFADGYEWGIYKFRQKDLLLFSDAATDARAFQNSGFHIEVLTLKMEKPKIEKLHRLAVAGATFHISAKPFGVFCRAERARAISS